MSGTTQEDAFLLVEGKEDQEIVFELREQHGVAENFRVKYAGSVSELLQSLAMELRGDDRRAIGVVIDADNNCQQRWQAICDRLQRAQVAYDLPAAPDAAGTIINPPAGSYLPRLGIWIMPDNQIEGALEDFVRACIPENDALVDYAHKALDEIESAQLHHYRQKRNKAFIYTWLAWQEEPGISMRVSFKKGALSPQAPLAVKFARWLKQLFDLPNLR